MNFEKKFYLLISSIRIFPRLSDSSICTDFIKQNKNNNEHCFVHKNFKRDNKGLLLEMKRKSKEQLQERKSEDSDSNSKTSELLKIVKSLQLKVKEQDK